MIAKVEVGVALRRPPRTDRISKIILDVDCPIETWNDQLLAENYARLLAIFMAQARPEVVMVTQVEIIDIVL